MLQKGQGKMRNNFEKVNAAWTINLQTYWLYKEMFPQHFGFLQQIFL
jgi:hypothetical protein